MIGAYLDLKFSSVSEIFGKTHGFFSPLSISRVKQPLTNLNILSLFVYLKVHIERAEL